MEELINAFNDIYDKYKTLKTSYKLKNKQNEELANTNNQLINEGEKLLNENEELSIKNTELNMDLKHMRIKISNLEKDIKDLKEKSNDLFNTVVKFTKGKENLDLILSSQKPSLYKHGIGFSPFKDKPNKNGFIRASTNENYIFVIKKHNAPRRVQRDRFGRIKTSPTKIWVPKTLLSSNVGT